MKSLVGKKALAYQLTDFHGETCRSDDAPGRWQLLVFHRHLG